MLLEARSEEVIRVSDFKAHGIINRRSQKQMVARVLEIQVGRGTRRPPDLSMESILSVCQSVHTCASGRTEIYQ